MAGSPIPAQEYRCINDSGECQDNFCDADTIIWDNVSVDVRPDAVPGDYDVVAQFPFNFNPWTVTISLQADGSYTVGNNYWSAFGANGGTADHPTIWSVYGPRPFVPPYVPPNSVDADGPVEITAAAGCGGHGSLVHASVRITFGSAPPSDLPADADNTKDDDDKTDCDPCCGGPMARYFFHLMLASLHIEDTPISYAPPRGPRIDFKVAYNQREANQPASFDYSNFGPKWTFNWLSYVTDNPNNLSANASVYVRGGGTEVYTGFNTDTQAYAPDPQSMAILVRTSGLAYEKRFRDGSKEVFSVSDGATSYPRRIFLTSIVDPSGNAVTLSYDSGSRLAAITDALGQATTLYYENSDDSLKITKVTDPFGRIARFDYSDGELSRITDPVGIQSQFHYQDGPDFFIDTMTTPYGATTFTTGETGNSQRWVEATDPIGGKERVEYDDMSTVPVQDSSAPDGVYNLALNRTNTFFWGKKAMAEAPGDFESARMIHWLTSTDGTQVSGIKHSDRSLIETRVWYSYSGQPSGAAVGTSGLPIKTQRLLDDNSTQQWQFQYNAVGNLTQQIDPIGRVTSYHYDANGIDLLTIYQRNSAGTSTDPDGQNADVVGTHTYNSQHKPVLDTDAAGQPTHYGYNAYGQLTSVQNAKNETTTYNYSDGTIGGVPNGYLASITSPAFNGSSAITTFAYDSANRVRMVTTSPDNYVVTTDYDNIDRPTQLAYPDGTTQQFQYSQDFGNGAQTILDLTASKDRVGRWTTRHYNGNRQIDSITDPLGQTTLYDWCSCGALASITDPNGNLTTFYRDLHSRLTSKVFSDGSTLNYFYGGATGRLREILNVTSSRETDYSYFTDDNINQIRYSKPFFNIAPIPATAVSFTYDPSYNRVASMTDGIGPTNYTYYPVASGTLGAGKLYQTTGPLQNSTITYGYDELGRVISQDINGTAATIGYDSLGRIGTTTNALGSFTRTYDGATPRLLNFNYPNGQTANYNYFGNNNDRRLQTLQNQAGNSSTLSQFDYTYDPEGQIQTWNKKLGANETDLSFGYDDAKRLLSVGQPGMTFGYDYDAAGNRVDSSFHGSHHIHGGSTYTVNGLNQLDTVLRNSGFGPTSTDPVPIMYDVSGNMTYDGNNQTFEWDAANRLAAINYLDSGGRTEFAYDGLGRRVKISEYSGVTTATIEPADGNYTSFSTAPFTVPAGNYTLLFQGLDPTINDNAALIDAVALNNVLVPNGSFESPMLNDGAVKYDPSDDPAWSYSHQFLAGIAANDSFYTDLNPPAPDGQQVGFVESNGSLWQSLALAAGTYTLSFQAAQAVDYNEGPNQQLRVIIRGTPATVKTFVWCGNTICEERDASGANVTKRYFGEGEQRVGGADAGNYYYSRDHLGSVRDVTDASGHLVAQFDYDAWGNEVVVAGNMNVDFGFTGHYFHQPSGMNLSVSRLQSFVRPLD